METLEGLAGSRMLNIRFEGIIKAAVGSAQYVTLRTTAGYRFALRQFDELIKFDFNPFKDPVGKEYFISFPNAGLEDDARNLIRADIYTLTQLGILYPLEPGNISNVRLFNRATLKQIFNPWTDSILCLVEEQILRMKIKRMEDRVNGTLEIKVRRLTRIWIETHTARQFLLSEAPVQTCI
jgi:hypothetical protein